LAPKAEIEIYKSDENGFLHTTKPLDTVKAAKLLYQVSDNHYGIRDYNGIVEILKSLNYKSIYLFSDNVRKFNSLKSLGIDIRRLPTNTNKSSCINHILAKKMINHFILTREIYEFYIFSNLGCYTNDFWSFNRFTRYGNNITYRKRAIS